MEADARVAVWAKHDAKLTMVDGGPVPNEREGLATG